ncbi:MAG: hypothetical protein R3Y07_07725 [Eubacteriales bacterium]
MPLQANGMKIQTFQELINPEGANHPISTIELSTLEHFPDHKFKLY